MKQKIMFLYLKTAGGHVSSARAISSYLDRHYSSEVETLMIDDVEEQSDFANFLSNLWEFVQYRAKWVAEANYALGRVDPLCNVPMKRFEKSAMGYLEERILRDKPDKIILLHYLFRSVVNKIIKKHSLDIKVRVVVTDPFTVHNIWLGGKEYKYMMFSRKAKRYAIKKKIKKENIELFPYFVNEKYSKKPTTRQIESCKKRFGVDNGKRTILYNATGNSIEKAESLVSAFLRNKIDVNFLIMCGKSKELKRKMELLAMEYPRMTIKLFGYVGFVDKLLVASDFVISKAGPATIFEILLLDKIPIITTYFWKQEKGNVDFVVNNGLGFYEPRVKRIPLLFKEIISEQGIVDQININRESLDLSNGLSEVGKYIVEM